MTKPQKLDPGIANAPGMKWYLPEIHHSGVPFSAQCCPQFRTKKECMDAIREGLWFAKEDDGSRRNE